jgi:uncharacterized protein YdaU (DUF1376 family)
MAKAPYFHFYYEDFLSGVKYFNTEEIGAYILLLIYQWEFNYVVIDEKSIKKITKISKKKCEKVLEKFIETSPGKFQNLRLEIEREKYVKFINKQCSNGSKGGRPSKNENPKETQKKPNNNPDINPDINPEKPTARNSYSNTDVLLPITHNSEDTNVSKAHAPELKAVEEIFWQMGVTDKGPAMHFFGHYEARGWCTESGVPLGTSARALKGLVMAWVNNPIASKQTTAAPVSAAAAAYQTNYNPNDPKYRD